MKHDFGHGAFGGCTIFILLYQTDGEFAQHIQILLDGFILDPTVILAIVYIQYPVHRLHCPFHSGTTKQLRRR